MRILIAEDDRDLCTIIAKKMKSCDYSVDTAFDGREAFEYIDVADYDAVILDIMMPEHDGFEVLSHIKAKNPAIPVLFLTARDSIEDRVLGLDSGASDYLIKPFSLDELSARVRVMLRAKSSNVTSVLRVGDLELDTTKKTVIRSGRIITLSAKEYSLLEYMMHNSDIILSRSQIEDHIWDFTYEGGTNVVDVYISYLRKKIDEGCERKLIRTIRGRGYMISDRQ